MAISSGLGSRYGRKVRRKYDTVVANYKFKKQVCPFCGMKKVRRVAAGIFECAYCKKRFSGGAYEAETRIGKAIKSAIGKSVEAVEAMLDTAVIEEEKELEPKEEKGEKEEVKKKKKSPKETIEE